MSACVLAHDLGTSSLKSALINEDGQVLASVSTRYPETRLSNGVVTQCPDDWVEAMRANMDALSSLSASSDRLRQACAVGISGHMLGLLPVAADGTPLYPHMTHADTRAMDQSRHVLRLVGEEELYRLTGNRADARSPLCKLLWLKENEPSVYSRIRYVLQSKDYLASCLTGRISTDMSDSSHAQWMDIRKRVYARDLLSGLGLDPDLLPPMHPSTLSYGCVTTAASRLFSVPAGIPVFAGGDGICASLGAGVYANEETYLCYGTTAWVASMTAHPFLDSRQRLFNLVNADGITYGLYGTVQCAGRAVDWIMSLLKCPSYDEAWALAEQASADVPLFLPYLEGERTPWYDARARGVFFGLSGSHGPAELLRAVAEGVAFALRDVVSVYREKQPVPRLRLIGGGGRSGFLLRLLASVLDLEVIPCTAAPDHASAAGASIIALTGAGVYRDLEEGVRHIATGPAVYPEAAAGAVYQKKHALYHQLYPSLKEHFAALSAL